ncbi:GFA family protein [Gilvimarinus agarilyticus]|uniref:GFA family protein n=1 Tax=Gilvimarinus sp. 2_MG-2023 TaxID=3062666 RepID=UPI001C09F435|nr:GFA family protein [Gilvimarinus sp. 2_MG-2023]MBU2886798.1 GFA family protein [Gilvimarinus agarilyticus]MDO6571462.1 GFA family protein [Gilvimarinus sp. 2_MG-2023]
MNNTQYPIEGSCQCGQVRYQLLAAPKVVVACHCKECQKLSTSAFSITAMVNADDLVFHGEMKDWRRVADSGKTSAAKFCPQCGNRLYHYDPQEPNNIKLKPSNLSDTSIIQPTMHVWVSEKQNWYVIPDGVKVFSQQP